MCSSDLHAQVRGETRSSMQATMLARGSPDTKTSMNTRKKMGQSQKNAQKVESWHKDVPATVPTTAAEVEEEAGAKDQLEQGALHVHAAVEELFL